MGDQAPPNQGDTLMRLRPSGTLERVVLKLNVEGTSLAVVCDESSDGFLFRREVMIQPWTATVLALLCCASRCGA